MTDEDKGRQLVEIIDNLCESKFSQNTELQIAIIEKLNKIYANNYRHTYSDIFFKIQEIISLQTDNPEFLETLGENLNVLGDKINEAIINDPDDANIKHTSEGFKKFSDHIKLEIGRYNFISTHFGQTFQETQKTNTESNIDLQALKKLEEKTDNLYKDFNNARFITTEAKSQLDKLDDKLESNKISSITTLTIFSAVVLAFSGGITFESGILKGMAEVSPYRLVFTIALTGFILFNTIFALLYLVGKMAGKSLEVKCRFLCQNAKIPDEAIVCGDGYCKKDCISSGISCKAIHKYPYVVIINIILLWILYADFILWLFKGNELSLSIWIFQLVPIGIFFIIWIVGQINKIENANRIKLAFKIQVIKDILKVEIDEENPLLSTINAVLLSFKSKNTGDKFIEKIENKKIKNKKEFKQILRELSLFADEELTKQQKWSKSISSKTNKINHRTWKELTERFYVYLLEDKGK